MTKPGSPKPASPKPASINSASLKPRPSAAAPISDAPPEPFSRPFLVEELLRRPDEPFTIEADADELKALAEADGLPGISMLKATVRVARMAKMVHVTGEVRARVTQICVVSLDPFDSEIVEPIDVRFSTETAPPPPMSPRKAEALERQSRRRGGRDEPPPPPPPPVLDLDEDPPDPIIDGRIDLGALASEFLALGLDPYPRKPGVAFEAPEAPPEEESPFAALARLRKPE